MLKILLKLMSLAKTCRKLQLKTVKLLEKTLMVFVLII